MIHLDERCLGESRRGVSRDVSDDMTTRRLIGRYL
jgi:hypothetical protein